MSKKKSKNTSVESTDTNNQTVANTATIANTATPAATTATVEFTLPKGRPVNPNSARQVKLVAMAAKREAGELHRGRPIDPTSKRQTALANKGEGKTGAGKTGRPVNENSARQIKLAERAAKIAKLKAEHEARQTAAPAVEA